MKQRARSGSFRQSGPTACNAGFALGHGPCCSLAVLAAAGLLLAAGCGEALADRPGTVLPANVVPRLRNIVQGIQSISTAGTATGNLMSILQNQRSAIVNWDSFNIGRGSEVRFLQPDSGARVLNRVLDADPSIIQGALSANGQVYLLNRNGILFDRGSQVNVNTLLASSLNISDADFVKGFAGASTYNGVAPYTKFEAVDENGQPYSPGPVLVNVHGAAGDSARLSAAQEGSIILLAPMIENRGIITAPDGQVILAAGSKAYLWQRNTDNTTDPKALALRGLMVEITAGDGPVNVTSLVNNLGDITADRGNVSIAALAINQGGRISAGSSVVRNGSIWQTARSVSEPANGAFDFDIDGDGSGGGFKGREVVQHGAVTFAPGSVTETPLLNDGATLSHSDGYANFQATVTSDSGATTTVPRDFRSWIHVVGNKIHNQGEIVAPGGTIELIARDAGGRILLDSGSLLSAAGNWADLAMESNIVNVSRLTSNDLKDAPLQRDGSLLGAPVAFDLRKGSTLFITQPYVDNQLETVQQKATAGGEILLEARQGDVVSAPGSVVDVSGGGARYAAGYLATTKLISEDGKVYDITTASPLLRYLGTTDLLKRNYFKAGPMGWNVTRDFAGRFATAATYESAYVQGSAGGSLTVVAPRIVQGGDWRGGATLGRYQVSATDPSVVPAGATLTIGDSTGGANPNTPEYLANRIRFGAAPVLEDGFDLDSPLPAGAADGTVILAADNFRLDPMAAETYSYDGFGKLALYADDAISVPAGTTVALPPGGVFSARALGSIELESARDGKAGGAIAAPAGKVGLTA
ncbi:MAG: filamentous hemagglutinin N-terminal domain-containing protein, partial [Rhodocyclaceae bacterium]